jgi:uncharacterized protein YqeY
VSSKEKIQNDVKEALRAGDSKKRVVLSMLLSVIKNRELEKRSKLAKSGTQNEELEKLSVLTEEESLDAVASEVKKRKESIETYRKGNREDLAEKEKEELDILMEYMPEQMPESRLREIVENAVNEVDAKDIKDMGKVMSKIMSEVKGKIDGQTVSRVVKELLS